MKPHRRQQFTFSSAYLAIALGILLIAKAANPTRPKSNAISYTNLLEEVRAGKVSRIELGSNTIVAELRTDSAEARRQLRTTSRLPGIEERGLLEAMEAAKVELTGRIERPSVLSSMLGWILPFMILMGVYFFLMHRINRRGGPLSVGRSHAKIYDQNAEKRVSFADVAGAEEAEAELVEVVSFLKDPARYRALGARIPKGVLLVGPPGTGKTLLARAVAGEAGVPFFSLSGSEFVEMFVGVGAARMRSLFEQAKERAPCIVFIDELDAIGKSRGGVGAMATNDEREQTLNQLLVEMDGFDGESGVIIMAATNRPEVLDAALLRAGRFDRQVLVDRPDVRGRLEILKVHARRVRLEPDVSLDTVAQRTPGMSGADLANVVNEAALAAGRRTAAAVSHHDFEEAVDRIQLGLKQRGKVMTVDEKRRVAVHEAGHALVALSVAHADPVHRVSIIPRSIGALGVTLQLPEDDRYLLTGPEIEDRLCVLFGGRAAERLILGGVSSGAANDIERATALARQMVCHFGMADALGPVALGRSVRARFLQGVVADEPDYSDATARAIDAEIRRVLEEQEARARAIVGARQNALERLTRALLERETLERDDVEALVRGVSPPPAAKPGAGVPARERVPA